MLQRTTTHIENGAGWRLALHRYLDPEHHDATRRPVVMVPGFMMNSFILGYHPKGPGIAPYLAQRGFEVWAVDLRGQGASEHLSGPKHYRIEDLGLVDLAAAIEGVLERTAGRDDAVDVIGCSLGATYMFMQAAWWPEARIARMVSLGGPLRWTAVHPAVKLIAAAPAPIWRALRMRNTRAIARRGLPLAARIPKLLHLYMHPAICDLSEPEQLTQTIDDASPLVNAQIAHWVRAGDFKMNGRNLTNDVGRLALPLLSVVANADGLVPEDTVCSAHNVMDLSPRRDVLYAGDAARPMAHADLFISDPAPELVFAPLAAWLEKDASPATDSTQPD
jgi:pimeloyl-ACP methyl ester carboxylesterase